MKGGGGIMYFLGRIKTFSQQSRQHRQPPLTNTIKKSQISIFKYIYIIYILELKDQF